MRKFILAKTRSKHFQVKYNVNLNNCFSVSFPENSVEFLVYMQAGYAWVVNMNWSMDGGLF